MSEKNVLKRGSERAVRGLLFCRQTGVLPVGWSDHGFSLAQGQGTGKQLQAVWVSCEPYWTPTSSGVFSPALTACHFPRPWVPVLNLCTCSQLVYHSSFFRNHFSEIKTYQIEAVHKWMNKRGKSPTCGPLPTSSRYSVTACGVAPQIFFYICTNTDFHLSKIRIMQ